MKRNIINRMKEPSTWAGLGVFVAMAGVDPHKWDLISQAGAAIAAALAVFLPEKAGS